jgi:hypothetical protein
VTVTPRAGFTGTVRVAYSANDALGLPSRVVRGSFDVVVIGPPGAPGRPRLVGSPLEDKVELQWDAPQSNNADIDFYQVDYSGGEKKCEASPCTVTGLALGASYTFRVRAHNEAGFSPPSEVSRPVLVDVPPSPPAAAPTAVAGDSSVTVAWPAAASRGSAVSSYVLTFTGAGAPAPVTTGGDERSRTVQGFTNGVEYTVTVTAVNGAQSPGGASPPARFTPIGPPGRPQLTLGRQDSDSTFLTVSWTAGTANGSGVTTTVAVKDTTGGGTTTLVSGSAAAADTAVQAATPGHAYEVTAVSASNNGMEGDALTETIVMWGPPAAPSVGATGDFPARGQATVTVSLGSGWTPHRAQTISLSLRIVDQADAVMATPSVTSGAPVVVDLPAGVYWVVGTACVAPVPANDSHSCTSTAAQRFDVTGAPNPTAVDNATLTQAWTFHEPRKDPIRDARASWGIRRNVPATR